MTSAARESMRLVLMLRLLQFQAQPVNHVGLASLDNR
jgi:hypothetical protein